MKFCSFFKPKEKACKVELQMDKSRRQIAEVNSQIDEMKATLDGEIDWFLVVESSEARDRERNLTQKVEEVCSVT